MFCNILFSVLACRSHAHSGRSCVDLNAGHLKLHFKTKSETLACIQPEINKRMFIMAANELPVALSCGDVGFRCNDVNLLEPEV